MNEQILINQVTLCEADGRKWWSAVGNPLLCFYDVHRKKAYDLWGGKPENMPAYGPPEGEGVVTWDLPQALVCIADKRQSKNTDENGQPREYWVPVNLGLAGQTPAPAAVLEELQAAAQDLTPLELSESEARTIAKTWAQDEAETALASLAPALIAAKLHYDQVKRARLDAEAEAVRQLLNDKPWLLDDETQAKDAFQSLMVDVTERMTDLSNIGISGQVADAQFQINAVDRRSLNPDELDWIRDELAASPNTWHLLQVDEAAVLALPLEVLEFLDLGDAIQTETEYKPVCRWSRMEKLHPTDAEGEGDG